MEILSLFSESAITSPLCQIKACIVMIHIEISTGFLVIGFNFFILIVSILTLKLVAGIFYFVKRW